MKKCIVFVLLFMLCADIFCDPAEGRTGPLGIEVSLNLPMLVDDLTQIAFTKDPITTPKDEAGNVISNYSDFDNRKPLADSVRLAVTVSDPEYYGHAEDFYITWRIYSSKRINVIVSILDHMSSKDTADTINWMVYVPGDMNRKSGTIESAPGPDYKKGEIIAYTSKLTDPGICGSCPLAIKTQSLWGKTVAAYTGYLVATVKPAE